MPETYKWYVVDWKHRPEPNESIVDYRFSHDVSKAATWPTEKQANDDADFLSKQHIAVVLASDHTSHVCENFKVEAQTATEFVLYCEFPFPTSAVEKIIGWPAWGDPTVQQ